MRSSPSHARSSGATTCRSTTARGRSGAPTLTRRWPRAQRSEGPWCGGGGSLCVQGLASGRPPAPRPGSRPGQLKRMDDGPRLISSIDLKSYNVDAVLCSGFTSQTWWELAVAPASRRPRVRHALGQDFSKSAQSGPPVQLGYVPFWLVAAAAPAWRAVGCALCAYGNRGGQAAALACAAGTWRNHVRLGLRGWSHATHGGARVWRG